MLSFHNHTEEPLAFHYQDRQYLVQPGCSHKVAGNERRHKSLSIASDGDSSRMSFIPRVAHPLKSFTGATWKVLQKAQWPWIIYNLKVSLDHLAVIALPKRDPTTFLSCMPDTLSLAGLLLPGTHQTMAFRGWPLAQCQARSTPLETQLDSGIRVLDVRISLYDGILETAHDILPMGTKFATILKTLRTFLAGRGKSETVVMSIKQEDWKTTNDHTFSAAVRKEIEEHDPEGLSGWFLENRVPNLGEVRGKVVLFSRFGADGAEWEKGLNGLGIHPTSWPDSRPEGFEWTCAGKRIRVQDWYRVPTFLSIPEKLRRARHVLTPDGQSTGEKGHEALAIAFMSASAIPFALPPTIARGFGWPNLGLGVEGVNARLTRWCLRLLADDGLDEAYAECENWLATPRQPRIRGWVLLDFYDDPKKSLVPLMIEFNFKGRVGGEEGWPGSPLPVYTSVDPQYND